MNNDSKLKLFLVDDDTVFLKKLEIEFQQSEEFTVETYPTGEACIAHLLHHPDVIILDYQLDGIEQNAINGIQTLDLIREFDLSIPVVMLSSQDSIEVAVDCMHHKAFDYVVKSETAFIRLQKIIKTIVQFKKLEKKLTWYMERM